MFDRGMTIAPGDRVYEVRPKRRSKLRVGRASESLRIVAHGSGRATVAYAPREAATFESLEELLELHGLTLADLVERESP